jgi:membrane fusion protein (multidrug efflux system)
MSIVRSTAGETKRAAWGATILAGGALAVWSAAQLAAQEAGPVPGQRTPVGGGSAAAAERQAVIERMPLVARPAQSYQAPLHLEPVTSLELVAQVDGIVSNISIKPGDKISAHSEAVRLESTERQLELDRAKAAYHASQLEQAAANAQAAELASARLDVSKFELRLAEHRLEQTMIRAPFAGTITRVHVVQGQFVRTGQPLATLADLTRVTVEMPVDRKSVKPGESITVKVEDATANGTLEAVLPLAERFEPLRDLFQSIASGRVVIDNSSGQFSVGQTVYSEMIPRQPVVEVPTVTVGNTPEGLRKVQVIRAGFVRDVPVELLGQVGDSHIFVTGRFAVTDELIVKTSEELLDGTRVVPAGEAGPARAAAGAGPTTRTETGF